ncbi:hypothetical protein GXM_09494 [Nostoc sphaeroides CCNUC1]|uniref:Uncharacterized protein n=1 Tax=Nostoc sphaeroides CCNUC1 TaxID=2653204 RepID=A0A5P8WHB7_9NOSO|nr:hypothetical protein GXM_09494 [Nostoc sphaeroides CCNUC1]
MSAIPTPHLAIALASVTSYYRTNFQIFSQKLRKSFPSPS